MSRSRKKGRLPEELNRQRQRNGASKTPASGRALRDCDSPSASPAAGRNVYAAWAICSLLLLAVAVVFGPTLQYDFVNYDDNMNVYQNAAIRHGLDADGIHWALTTRQGGLWAPVTWLSYLLDYEIYGLKPWGYHLTNVVLHAATTVLLFLVLWRMTGELWPCAFVAAVFAIHPLHVETVAWVSERKGLLSGLFFVLSLAAYLHYVRRPFSLWRYLMVAVFFAVSLMSKPMIVTLPFVLLLLDYWPLGRMAAEPLRRLIAEKIPWLLLTVAAGIASFWAEGETVIALEKLPLSARIGNALVSYVAYLEKTFWPANLAVFYPHPGACLADVETVGRVARVVGHHGLRAGPLAAESLLAGRLAVVSGNARAGNRPGANQRARDGRPLYVSAADRSMPRCDVGSVVRRPIVAPSGLGLRRGRVAGSRGPYGVCGTTDNLLARTAKPSGRTRSIPLHRTPWRSPISAWLCWIAESGTRRSSGFRRPCELTRSVRMPNAGSA